VARVKTILLPSRVSPIINLLFLTWYQRARVSSLPSPSSRHLPAGAASRHSPLARAHRRAAPARDCRAGAPPRARLLPCSRLSRGRAPRTRLLCAGVLPVRAPRAAASLQRAHRVALPSTRAEPRRLSSTAGAPPYPRVGRRPSPAPAPSLHPLPVSARCALDAASEAPPPPMAGEQRPLSPSTFPPLSSWARAASPGGRAAAGGAVTGAWGFPVPASPALGSAWGAGPRDASGTLLTAARTAMALAAVADVVPTGVASQADPPPPVPPSLVGNPPPVVDQPPPPPVAHQGYTIAALTAARAEHAARQTRLREAALVWEREREAADAIAAQIAAAE
jgi:hypothetical protein